MRKPVVLVTGANGEIGHALIGRLVKAGDLVVAIDVNPLDRTVADLVAREFVGSVTDHALLERIMAEFEVDRIFHLAAILSTRAEFAPLTAHQVNVEGTLAMLEFAQHEGESHGRRVLFVYPSSIAVYGLPNADAKARAGAIREDQHTHPTTMYGCTKLYSEELGRYYARHYKQLSVGSTPMVDFRAVRFPGLISALTMPAGGTSDYAPEMIHAAARGEPYECFVGPETRLPFMAMPDAVDALLALAAGPSSALTRTAYNARAFSASAEEIRHAVVAAFPHASITYRVDAKRQAIVDSWPADVDDTTARAEWNFRPAYDFDRAFRECLIPEIQRRYSE